MTPPNSLIDALASNRFVRRPAWRRAGVLVIVLICAVLTLYPHRYRAAVSLTPTDPSSLGLGGAFGQLGATSSVFGNQAAIEVSMRVARSMDVRQIVISRLDLVKKMGFSDADAADRWLTRNTTIRSLRGGVVQVEVYRSDPVFAKALVSAFADATRARLAEISRKQTEYKHDVLVKMVRDAGNRMGAAQSAYDEFRLRTRYSQPTSAISAIGERIPLLQESIKAKEVQLNAARQFGTDDNMAVRQLLAEIEALNVQLDEARRVSPTVPESVGRVVNDSTKARDLERELFIARALYESYKRFLEGTSVEELTSAANIRIIEPPYVDSARQWNMIPFAFGLLVLLAGLAVEFYQLRPPVGSRAGRQS